MERNKVGELCIEIFNSFQGELMGRPDYSVNLSENNKVTLEKYIDYVDKEYGLNHVGVRFFIDWLESAFNYYYKNPKARGLKRMIFFNWILGKKAISRHEKFKQYDHGRTRVISLESGISIIRRWEDDGFRKIFREQCIGIDKAEEVSKGMYFNTVEGYVYCVANTSLYNHLSEACMLCNYIKNCKENLKKNFPLLYKLRGYGK